MDKIYHNTINEIQKLFAKRSIKIYLIISAIIPLILSWLGRLQDNMGFNALDASTFPLFLLNISLNVLLPIFSFMIITELFSAEKGDKTLQLVLVRPISRLNIFLSKVAAIGCYLMIQLAILWITGTVGALFFFENGNVYSLTASLFAYFVSWQPLMVVGIIAIFVAQWFKSSGRALFLLILLFGTAGVVPFLFPEAAFVIPTYYLDWYSIWVDNIQITTILNSQLYLLSCSVLFFTLGYYKFKNQEL